MTFGYAKNENLYTKNDKSTLTPEQRAKRRLEIMAAEHDFPFNDLLEWYRDDLAQIADMEAESCKAMIRDFIAHRNFYKLMRDAT